jgi:nickel transport protein
VSRAVALLAAVAAVLAPAAASGHEVLHEIDRNRAVAVKAYFGNGEVLAYAQYEVYSPADAKIPHQKGRTDRSGWVSFVPDVAGKWRVKVVDDTGHGLDLEVDAAPASTAITAPSTAAPDSTTAFVLRPLVGVAVIAALFGVLFAIYRRKGTAR